jgi:hypothetical protein
MKFKQYINEMAYKPTKKEIKKAIKELSKQNRVKPQYLDFIGAEDYRGEGVEEMGYILLYFNIEDPKHYRYRSTIGYILK